MMLSEYCTISFKSTRGVTRDMFYLFDISVETLVAHDTPQNFDILTQNFVFLAFFGIFGACVTVWRFDRRQSDA
jgi:hypothetical protein